MSDNIQITISIESIKEREFSIVPNADMPSGDIAQHLAINHHVITTLDQTNHHVSVDAGIRYNIEEKELCKLIITVVFKVEPFDSLINIDTENRSITFSADFIPSLLNVAYGALRGVFAEKTKDTVISSYPIQMSSIEELVKMNRYKVL